VEEEDRKGNSLSRNFCFRTCRRENTPNFTYFVTALADTAVASYVMQIDTVCYNRSASNKMESNNGSLTMTNEAAYPVMKFVLRHAYATSAFTFVRAHA
jgi:hypothetical protein